MPAAPQPRPGLSQPGASTCYARKAVRLNCVSRCFGIPHGQRALTPVDLGVTEGPLIRPRAVALPRPMLAPSQRRRRSISSCAASGSEGAWDPPSTDDSGDSSSDGGPHAAAEDRSKFPPLLQRGIDAARTHLKVLLCIALAAWGMHVGGAKAGELHRQQAATRGQAPQTARMAEHRNSRPARQRQAYSWQDSALLLDSRRAARARPADSPVWLSAAQQRQQPALLPRPATQFAAMSSPVTFHWRSPT